MKPEDLDLIVELAQEVETQDPIDWGMLSISEVEAYRLIANNLLEHFLSLDADDRELAMMSTLVKLTVENFVLNLKLEHAGQ